MLRDFQDLAGRGFDASNLADMGWLDRALTTFLLTAEGRDAAEMMLRALFVETAVSLTRPWPTGGVD